MPTATTATTAAVPATTITVLTWLKYLLPIAAGLASIWIHNATTVTEIGETVGGIETGLGAVTPQ